MVAPHRLAAPGAPGAEMLRAAEETLPWESRQRKPGSALPAAEECPDVLGTPDAATTAAAAPSPGLVELLPETSQKEILVTS
mmetsp:Transcript_25787/g.56914  ORF Transcript_25787/g.56914 Transcript_25787/m.56914 type:complete len:82 (+) Transcript_25787:2462-2707(+)